MDRRDDQQRAGARLDERREGRVDLAFVLRVQDIRLRIAPMVRPPASRRLHLGSGSVGSSNDDGDAT